MIIVDQLEIIESVNYTMFFVSFAILCFASFTNRFLFKKRNSFLLDFIISFLLIANFFFFFYILNDKYVLEKSNNNISVFLEEFEYDVENYEEMIEAAYTHNKNEQIFYKDIVNHLDVDIAFINYLYGNPPNDTEWYYFIIDKAVKHQSRWINYVDFMNLDRNSEKFFKSMMNTTDLSMSEIKTYVKEKRKGEKNE